MLPIFSFVVLPCVRSVAVLLLILFPPNLFGSSGSTSSRSATSTELGEGYVPPTTAPLNLASERASAEPPSFHFLLHVVCSVLAVLCCALGLTRSFCQKLSSAHFYICRENTQSADFFLHRRQKCVGGGYCIFSVAEKQTPT